MAIYSENHMKLINKFCGNTELLLGKANIINHISRQKSELIRAK
jgi:hypothetical protein